jgi:hypothetical protein
MKTLLALWLLGGIAIGQTTTTKDCWITPKSSPSFDGSYAATITCGDTVMLNGNAIIWGLDGVPFWTPRAVTLPLPEPTLKREKRKTIGSEIPGLYDYAWIVFPPAEDGRWHDDGHEQENYGARAYSSSKPASSTSSITLSRNFSMRGLSVASSLFFSFCVSLAITSIIARFQRITAKLLYALRKELYF